MLFHSLLWGQQTIEIPIVSSSDDAEELGPQETNSELNEGELDLASSDLELVDDNSWNGPGLHVGLRFKNLDFPKGTVINSAYIVFEAKENQSDQADLMIAIEDHVDASGFENSPNNISGRSLVTQTVDWSNVEAWEGGNSYQTPDVKELINEIIAKDDWVEGGDLVFVITGSGVRNARSFDGGTAPKLVVDYDAASVTYLPKVEEDIDDVTIGANWEYSLDLASYFSDRDSDLSFTALESGSAQLPGWLTLDGSILSGTPTQSGSYQIEVTATGDEAFKSQSFTIEITDQADFTLAIFHNNDGESHLLSEEVTYQGQTIQAGGVSQFKYTLDSLKLVAQNNGMESIMLSSGDNFLAGLEYNASSANGVLYDALAIEAIGYDAIDLGNHDFDFGTQVLADFIGQVTAPYLTSNLGFENVPELQALKDAEEIKPYTIVEKDGEEIGVIGLTTPLLPIISSPGNTTVSESIVDSVQKYVDELTTAGVNKIILISHLQGLDEDLAFIPQISGVDVVIAGGGDELLANNALIGKPYNADPYDTYPIVSKDKDDNDVYIVTTPGGYRFLGNLMVDFDAQGDIVQVYSSNPVFVHGKSDANLATNVEVPIEEYIGALATNVIASTDVDLDFRKESLRTMETNAGNLFADALLYQAQKEAANFGAEVPEVAIQNAGGLRIAAIVESGDFTEDLTYKIAAFSNIVSVVENVTPEKFLELVEHGIAEVPSANGRFPQIAGFKVVFDPTKDAGQRVKTIQLDNGTYIVENGEIAQNAPTIALTTNDFTANGGDGYPFDPLTYKTLGATYQQAFTNYLKNVDGLNGQVTSAQYPVDMNVRIIEELSEIAPLSAILLQEDFNGCDNGFAPNWISYNVASNADWSCSDDRRGASGEDGDYAAEMNGYGADVASEDWLISPEFELNGEDAYLSFSSMSKWGGPHIEVLVSNNYDGSSAPGTASWVNISEAEANAAQNDSYDYVEVENVLLEEMSGAYRVAFKYVSNGTGGGDGVTYRIDNVVVKSTVLVDENMNDVCSGDLTLPQGWTLFETETQGLVNCNSEGFEDDASDYSLRFNGYAVGAGEAWLVTPRLDFSLTDYELEFASKKQYSGPAVQVVYSTDYVGVGDPNEATWTNIASAEAAISGSFQKSGPIELEISEPGYVAFLYTSEGTSGGQSLSFLLDEISIKEPAVISNLGEVAIYEIQGSEDEAALLNGIVTTSGIVTATFNGVKPYPEAEYNGNISGFYIQDVEGDNDITTSDAMFVFSEETVTVGDSVVITGEVVEFFGMTQLSNLTSFQVVSSGSSLPGAVVLQLPLASKDDFEAYEGMLVSFPQTLSVTENRNVDIYGELKLSANGVLMNPTEVVDVNDAEISGVTADGLSNVDAVLAKQAENDANYVLLDDGRSGDFQTPNPYVNETGTIQSGSTVENVQGILVYSFSEYRVYPTAKPVITFSEREAVPTIENAEVIIATFNVQNYFNGDGQGGGFPTSRGAETEDDFIKQTSKIVSALVAMNADVVGLIEIENDANDGYSALKTLVDSVNNRLGSNVYDFVSTGVVKRADDSNDEIKNAFIYKSSTIELVGDYQILNNDFDVTYYDDKNRPCLAQTFKQIASEEEFTALINHLKSKGSGCDDLGDPNLSDGQGNCNDTRASAAAVIADWIETVPTGTEDTDYFILGDLNAYNQEDPIDVLRSKGYVNLNEGDYTYVYDGQFGTLDYALANASAQEQIVDAYVWHINSVEPFGLTYDMAGDKYINDAYRSSDHDPVVIGLVLDQVEPQDKPQDKPQDEPDITSINVTENEGVLKGHPNPSSGIVNFNRVTSGILYDVLGNVVLEIDEQEQIDLGDLNSGCYHLLSDKGYSLKLIKN